MPTIAAIKRTVAQRYGITDAEMVSSCRMVRLARPRQAAMYLARTMTGASLLAIGRKFGGRHHSTVFHAWRQMQGHCERGDYWADEIKALERILAST